MLNPQERELCMLLSAFVDLFEETVILLRSVQEKLGRWSLCDD
jgi:hypothetical protein